MTQSKGMICFSCGKEKMNIHLCQVRGGNQVICDECCKNIYQKEEKCKIRGCPHKTYKKNEEKI
ncbi:MAG: hypothetical protein EAX96_05460 [Candidatus Lokiarchaeota archaeon]|nr:hypothetical protein [Candidatus Lokiarchaeota archaeon]